MNANPGADCESKKWWQGQIVCETQIAELCVYDTGGTMFTFHKIQTVLRTN